MVAMGALQGGVFGVIFGVDRALLAPSRRPGVLRRVGRSGATGAGLGALVFCAEGAVGTLADLLAPGSPQAAAAAQAAAGAGGGAGVAGAVVAGRLKALIGTGARAGGILAFAALLSGTLAGQQR